MANTTLSQVLIGVHISVSPDEQIYCCIAKYSSTPIIS
jgi:hypothetical protein